MLALSGCDHRGGLAKPRWWRRAGWQAWWRCAIWPGS